MDELRARAYLDLLLDKDSRPTAAPATPRAATGEPGGSGERGGSGGEAGGPGTGGSGRRPRIRPGR